MRFPPVGRIRPVSHIDYVAELRLTQDRRDTTIRVAERAWVYTMKSLDRFPRGFILQGEHQCARNDLFEESS